MEFFINKNATLPILKMELIKDGRNDFHKFYEKVQNATILFSMSDVITGVKRIAKKSANLELVEPTSDCVGEEYYITYQFTERETNTCGKFIGQFEIIFLDGSGTLIAPLREELFINIMERTIKK